MMAAVVLCGAIIWSWPFSDSTLESQEPSCLIPTLPASDSCASVFATAAGKTCQRGKFTALCVDPPMRPVDHDAFKDAWSGASARIVRVQIIDGEMLVVPSGRNANCSETIKAWGMLRHTLGQIRQSAKVAPLPDVDLLLTTGDESPSWPIFSYNNPPGRAERTFLIPTHVGVGNSPKRRVSGTACEQPTPAELEHWSRKLDPVVFRGSATGPAVDSDHWMANTRARLSVLSKMFPSWIDASITRFEQIMPTNETRALSKFMAMGGRIPMNHFKYYKFIMDIDGNVQANRFPELTRFGSVVLQATQFETVLTASAHRFAHVFPIQPDLRDLLPKLYCLRARPVLLVQRLKHGIDIARELVTELNVVQRYWADLLQTYRALQRFPTVRHPAAISARQFAYRPIRTRLSADAVEGRREHPASCRYEFYTRDAAWANGLWPIGKNGQLGHDRR